MCLEATYWEKFSVSYNTLVSLTNTANCILITNWPFSCNLLYKGVGKPPNFLATKRPVVTEKSVYDIRRENLNILIDAYGSIAKINKLTGRLRTDSSLSQIRNQTVNTVNHSVRRMGKKLARTLEQQLRLGEGWFDVEHPEGGNISIVNVPFGDGGTVRISPVEKSDRLGGSQTKPKDFLEMGNRFLDKIVGVNAGASDSSGLRFHEVESDSFAELPRDTLVIVDTNVHQFTTMGFYLLRVRDNDLLVRIRQSIDGQFKVSMDDSLCEERESLDDVSIIGRAVYAWKGSRL